MPQLGAEMVSGDIQLLAFKVIDTDGNPVNLSTATDIDVQIFAIDPETEAPTGAALVSENLAGDVDLVGGGTAGDFSLALASADTDALAGDYWLEARIEDASNRFRTCDPVILRVKGDLYTS